MPRNYDTTDHKPYPRVPRLTISYSPSGVPSIEYIEAIAVVDGNNQVQQLDGNTSSHVMDLASITEPVQIVHPATGQAIPGQTITSQALMLGILAFLRADQLRRDAQADAAAQSEAGL